MILYEFYINHFYYKYKIKQYICIYLLKIISTFLFLLLFILSFSSERIRETELWSERNDSPDNETRVHLPGCSARLGCAFAHDGNKSFQRERTVVYRKSSSRSERWSREQSDKGLGSWILLPVLPILFSFSPALSLFLLCARPDLFIPFSVAGSLSSPTSSLFLVLLPVFCFRKRQSLIYTLSLHRAEPRGCFCV